MSHQISKRERRFPWKMQHVPIDQQDSKWQCETCSAPTENPESRWCLSCRMYWEDCRNGLFQDDFEPRCNCGHLFEICDAPSCPAISSHQRSQGE